ncbi:MAG TPA: MFS transporter [Burkholderiales bacterium]|nr:MFS transporter [Burkholderiales bacterium]
MSAWAPLRHHGYRILWLSSFAALTGSWISDSTAAWLMTSLSPSPLYVALVSSAITLPILLMALPAGALADLFDRHSVLIATQVWVTGVSLTLFAVSLAGKMTAELLLALTFAHGIGGAIRLPVVASMTPNLVPRAELPNALALHGVSYNGARVVGPVLAGLLLVWIGGPWVFLVCALISVAVTIAFGKGTRQQRASSLPNERFVAAMRLGLQFARQTPAMVAALAHVCVYTFFAVIMQALLPLVARDRLAGNAGTYTLLLSALGIGAIASVIVLPNLRRRLTRDQLLVTFAVMQAIATVTLSQATSAWIAAPALFFGGGAWVATFNTLSITAQMSLPDWVRARGTAVFLASGMVGATAGAFVWGQVASMASIERAMEISACGSLIALALVLRRYRLGSLRESDLTPAQVTPEFAAGATIEGDQGPVMVTIEYQIDPARAGEFSKVMAASRRWRLRHGALHWGMYRDVLDPGRYIEHFLVDSWLDRLRQIERLTAEDMALRDRKNAFHLGAEPPVMRHLLMEPTESR